MMVKTHPTDTVRRRLLEEPAGVADADRHHIAACAECLDALAAMRDETGPPGGSAAGNRPPAPSPGRARRVLRHPFVAAIAAAIVLAGGATAAANDWLEIFRTERITPIGLSTADLVALPELDEYGDVEVTSEADLHAVPDAAAAAAETGLVVPQVTMLPRGVRGEPAYQVVGEVSATFTFSADRAARAAADAGAVLPPPPPGLDGSRFRFVAGPGLAAAWSEARGVPALIVGRSAAPTVYADDIPFETATGYLLSLPGLPENVVSQLRNLSASGTALPLFLSVGQLESSTADVGGAPATVFTSRDGAMAAVVWVDDGMVNAVAGSVSADEALSVARGLRWDQ
jgi:hypothetical protein